MPVDTTKIIDLLIKYKNIITGLLCFIFCLICFVGGRYSVHIPPKEIVCKAEIATIEKQFKQLEGKDKVWTQKLTEQRDADEVECKSRIRAEVDRKQITTQVVDCETCKAIAPQCKRRKIPICK